MEDIDTLTNLLNNFDFASVDSTLTSSAIDAVLSFLNKAESHLASIVSSPPSSPPTSRASNPLPLNPIATSVDLKEGFLGKPLLDEIKKDLKTIKFSPMSNAKKSPGIALFGDSPYAFNNVTKSVKPLPITPSSTLFKVLDTVNSKLGVNFNSVLINKYRNKNISLGWHQDNETIVDQNVPIATLSVGCTRRFQISDNTVKADRIQFLEKDLTENSILIMKPGLQSSLFHRIVEGRENKRYDERGTRYSLTFRRLHESKSTPIPPTPNQEIPTTNTASPPVSQGPPAETTNPAQSNDHTNCVNTLVFGSSLTKDLDSDILSRRGKTFKVFTKGGARVETVAKMVRNAVDNKEVCTSCVQSIFLVVGGNDAENIKSESGIDKLKSSVNKLLNLINSKFPAIRINIVSLIPRRCWDYRHLQRIFCVNDFLFNLCSNENSNFYFINMFTKFLVKKDLYRHRQDVILNEKLFHKDRLHFSSVGTSVLAKTLIAVANNPH